MKLDREKLLCAYPQTPLAVAQRMEDTLETISRENQKALPRRYAARLRFATVLLVLLTLLAAIGVAAGIRLGVFDFMERMFGVSGVLPEASELVRQNLAALDLPHTVISVQEAVYDGGNLRVVYSVRVKDATAPITSGEMNDENSAFRKALAADDVSAWGCDWFYLDGTEYGMTGGSTGETIIGAENGEAVCYMDIYLASSGVVPEGDFKVSLPIVRHGRGVYETLDFTVRAYPSATALPMLHQNGVTVTVLSASLSPVRAYVNLRVERDEGVSERDYAFALADWQDAALVDARGVELSPLSEFQITRQEDGVSEDYSFTFLPTNAAEAYIAPTTITEKDEWLVDMMQAIQVK